MGIIAASLLKGNVTQEAVAGNIAGKVRAQEAADSALNYAEAWLTVARNASSGVACTTGTVSSAPVVCNASSPAPGTFNPNGLLSPPGTPGAIGTQFIPPSMTVSASGGANDYYQYPRYYIQFISIVTDGAGTPVGSLYRITAGGYGGNADQVAIVEAYYKIYSPSTATTGP
jgi:type IV pilus assembly protein PilX